MQDIEKKDKSPQVPLTIFYSCAPTKEDGDLQIQLETHLRILEYTGVITGWDAKKTLAGNERQQEINHHLTTAKIILLLLSPDFMENQYITDVPIAMKRHEENEALVILILLRPILYEGAVFERLETLPSNRRFITSWNDQDEAFEDVVKGIRKAIQQRWGQIIPGKNSLSSVDEQALSGTFLNEPSFQQTKRNSRWISRREILVGGIIGLCAIGTGATIAYKETHSVPTTLITYKGHTKAVWRVAWSPDRKRIASGGGDHTVQVWYAYGGRLFTTHRHSQAVRAIAWSPDKDYPRIASGGDDETIQVWEVNTQKLLYVYPGDKHIIWDVSWSPDGTRLAAASWNKTVPVWDAATGHIIAIYRGHTDTVRSVAWSPDSTRIASASRDLDVHIWEANTARLIATYQPHQTDTIMSVAWSPNGIYIASAGWDKTVRVWEAETGKNLINYTGHANTVLDIDWSPDSTSIASASMDSTAHVWEALTGKQICIYRDHKESVYSVKWSPDGGYLASGSGDNTVKVWKI